MTNRGRKHRRWCFLEPLENRLYMASNVLVSPVSGLITTETGGAASFSVRLANQPRFSVTLAVASTDPTEGVPGPTSLTFTPADWSTPKTVRVTGVNDFADNFHVPYRVVLGPAVSGDPAYSGVVPQAVSLTNLYDRPAIEAAALDEIAALKMAASMPGHGGSMHGEMEAAALKLVDLERVTAFAIRSGPWSDPATWLGSRVPGAADRAWVLPGRVVTVDRIVAEPVQTLRIGGTLAFAPTVDTSLRVDTVVVDRTGTFQMGAATAPIAANRTATLLITGASPIDREWDPYGMSRGLISLGTVTINGANKIGTGYLASVPAVGSTTLALTGPAAGWRPGDKIVLPGTSTRANEDEEFRVVSISGNVVTLDRAVRFARTRPAADLPMIVSNLTRNASIRSESTASLDRRGHVMTMHSHRFQVGNAGFYDLGRSDKRIEVNDPVLDHAGRLVPGTGTNPKGRYPVHIHMAGLDASKLVTVFGSVVEGSPNWGFVNHSSNVRFVDNISYMTFGAGFMSEDGDEVGWFFRNTALRSIGMDLSPHDNNREYKFDLGYNANGFWISGPSVLVEHNLAVGHIGIAGAGFMYLPGIKASRREANPVGIRNNLVYASSSGLELWFTPLFRNDGQPQDTQYHIVAGNTFYHVSNGIMAVYTNNVKAVGNRMYGDGRRIGDGILGNNTFSNLEARDNVIKGFRSGIDVPKGGRNVISGGVLDNVRDIVIRNNGSHFPHARSTGLPGEAWVRTTDINGVVFETGQPGKESTIYMWDNEPLYTINPYHQILPDIVRWDGKQVYYPKQGASTRLTGTGDNNVNTPMPFEGMTNAQAWARYGVAYAGAVAPADAVTRPWIRGLVGSPVTYDAASMYIPENFLVSGPTTTPTYIGPDRGVVRASSPVALPNLGWNVVTQTIGGRTRSFFLFRKDTGPEVVMISPTRYPASILSDPNATLSLVYQVTELNLMRAITITYSTLSQYLAPDARSLLLPYSFVGVAGAVTSGTTRVWLD